MMFKTTREVLDRIRKFHRMLSIYYDDVSKQTDQARLRLLLDYMSRHEKKFEENLARFGEESSKKLLDTWFKFLPDEDKLIGCEAMKIRPDMTIDDVISIALRVDDCLIQFYTEMAEGCVIKEIKDFFTNLSNMEKREKYNFSRNTAELQDL